MHPLYAKADAISGDVIGAAIEVHRDKGPGLIESVPIGLLINFHEVVLKNGIHRLILPGANQP